MGTQHTLDRHYSDNMGVDSRSNKLLQNVRTQRKGSKNFRYNYEDAYVKANGLQHRLLGSGIVDIFEYKFRDVNTGQAQSEVLSVQTDGKLYKRVSHTLNFIAVGAAVSYSFFYDEVSDGYIFRMNGIGDVAVSDTMTMEQLRVALNLLPGVSVQVFDQFGDVTTTSTKLAYLLKVTINNAFLDNESQFWTVIPFPDIVCVTTSQKTEKTVDYNVDYTWTTVPFPTTVKAQDSGTYPDVAENYEGISSTNLNNAIYITDGGFMMKYDGKVVYRSGIPHLNYTTPEGVSVTDVAKDFSNSNIVTADASTAVSTDLPYGSYYHTFRYGFTDYSGATNYGLEQKIPGSSGTIPVPPPANTNIYTEITIGGMWNGEDFPVFQCIPSSDQGNNTGAGITLQVDTGHNILPGMVLRQEIKTANTANKETRALGIGYYPKVVSVDSNEIVLQSIACTAGDLAYVATFYDNIPVNAYYTQTYYESKVPDANALPPGMFVEIYRTRLNQLGPNYLVYRGVLPRESTTTIVYRDNKADTQIVQSLLDADPGGELPRAGKYLTSWQSVITQAGLPPDSTLAQDMYPTSQPLVGTIYCQTRLNNNGIYTEAFMCDYQTIYYADILTSEGFPQDGLHEFAIDTQFSDQVKGIAQNKDTLFAFKERSTGLVSGDIGTNDLTLEVLEDDIGCVSHRSIQDVFGSLVWLDKDKGFYSCVAGRLPVPIGYPISDYQQVNIDNLDYSRARAANFRSLDLYICAVDSVWFVLDYADTAQGKRMCWYIWERFQAESLLNTSKDEHLIMDATGLTWQIKNTNTKYDFTDHKSAIEMNIKSAWLNYGSPTIDKIFSRVWINSIQGEFTLQVGSYANYRETLLSEIPVVFGNESRLTVKEWMKLPLPKTSACSIGFRNDEKNKFVRIQGWELEWTPAYDDGEPKR